MTIESLYSGRCERETLREAKKSGLIYRDADAYFATPVTIARKALELLSTVSFPTTVWVIGKVELYLGETDSEYDRLRENYRGNK